jgi:predicted MFS family arabinose efflux permease
MGITGIWAMLFALVIYLAVRDSPPGHPLEKRAPESLRQAVGGVREITRNRRFWWLLPLQSVGYGAAASVSALWAGPYLAEVHGLDSVARGNILFLMGLGAIAGVLAYAPLDRLFNTRKQIVLAGSLASVVVLMVLALLAHPPLALVTTLFVLLMVLSGYIAVLMSHVRVLFPDHLVGRGLTVANMCSMGGVALMQMATGAILGQFDAVARADGEAYRTVFLFLAVVLALAVAAYSRSDDIRPLG